MFSYPFVLMISDSRNERAEKHQHVPDLCWSLMEEMGFSFTTVNSYSGVSSFSLSWAKAGAAEKRQIAAAINILFISVCIL